MVVITSFKEPESAVKLQLNDVEIILDKKSFGMGTLYISERTLCWQKDDKTVGFTLDYYHITLHAVSKDRNVCDKECIYILTDPHINMPGDRVEEQNAENSDTESEADVSELNLVPISSELLESMYEAIKTCQELNPDPADIDDDDDDDNLYADAEDEMQMNDSDHLAAGDIDNLARRLENNSVHVEYNYNNHENDDEFEDAD